MDMVYEMREVNKKKLFRRIHTQIPTYLLRKFIRYLSVSWDC
jgi:hypothetical protein